MDRFILVVRFFWCIFFLFFWAKTFQCTKFSSRRIFSTWVNILNDNDMIHNYFSYILVGRFRHARFSWSNHTRNWYWNLFKHCEGKNHSYFYKKRLYSNYFARKSFIITQLINHASALLIKSQNIAHLHWFYQTSFIIIDWE